jgi:putrescine transport system permease protein
MMQTDFAVYVGIVYTYLPFMILPLYANLVKLDSALLEASADLGARPWQTFLSVTLPLSMPGILAGLHAGVHPGGRRVRHPRAARRPGHADDRPRAVGRVLLQPRLAGASAVAIAMLVIVVIPIMLMQRAQSAVVEGA